MKKSIVVYILVILALLCGCGKTSSEISETIPEPTPEPIIETPLPVLILGKEYSSDTKELDLSDINSANISQVVSALSELSNLERIELMPASGESSLEWADFSSIAAAAPDAEVHFSKDLFGQTLDTVSTDRLEYVKTKIGDDGLEVFGSILPYVTGLKYVSFDRCDTTDEVCAKLRDDCPDTEVVWRVYFGPFTCMTDAETIWASCDLTDENDRALKYCTKLKNLDIGHDPITNLDFLDYMPDLEVLIISGDEMAEIEHVASCKNLKFLETVECTYLTDISPIAELENLEQLNIGGCQGLKDLSPVYGLKNLRRMYAPNLFQSCLNMQEEQKKLEALMPNAEVDCGWYADGAAVGTWRYSGGGWTGSYVPDYVVLRQIFGYDYMENSPYRIRTSDLY